ncbi:outer membrane protein [Microvirga arsenatis]|uniref:Porin family protein n=1 Tax=Microvirga arsenatis TaxID=2692265 RepID=A0ABW9Z059_9HYPH|nr:porin family protein [Microvirga arsenatis]NBJ11970.1 hypothetical protein [Microvirga arsenatis]NBJ26039.1 hypothetical protein [Microvirga arsenatis]
MIHFIAVTGNLSARAEYRYTQFDNLSNDLTPLFNSRVTSDADVEFHTVRVGVSYKFGSY